MQADTKNGESTFDGTKEAARKVFVSVKALAVGLLHREYRRLSPAIATVETTLNTANVKTANLIVWFLNKATGSPEFRRIG